MSVEIRVIPKDKKSLKKFVQFGTDMYKGNDCFVPPLRMDDVNTLSPDVNPAFELCDAEYFMASATESLWDALLQSSIASQTSSEARRRCVSDLWSLSMTRKCATRFSTLP